MPQKAVAAIDITNDTENADKTLKVLVALQTNYMIPTVEQILDVDRPKPDNNCRNSGPASYQQLDITSTKQTSSYVQRSSCLLGKRNLC